MPAEPATGAGADRSALGSAALAGGTIDAVSPKFAEGLARVREVTDTDGACLAWAKALYMAAAAAVKGHRAMLMAQMERSRDLGLELTDARGAALTVLISRGEAVYATFNAAVDEVLLSVYEEPSLDERAQGRPWLAFEHLSERFARPWPPFWARSASGRWRFERFMLPIRS